MEEKATRVRVYRQLAIYKAREKGEALTAKQLEFFNLPLALATTLSWGVRDDPDESVREQALLLMEK